MQDMADQRYVITERAGGVGRLTFNRPELENRYDVAMMGEIRDAVAALAADDDVRVVVLTGVGNSFCAGADPAFLDAIAAMDPDRIKRTVYASFQGAVRAIKLCPKPTIAEVRGPAFVAGCEMAVACDFRLADETARFREGWIDFGLVPPLGGMFLLPQLVGLGKATEMVMLGTTVDATEAAAIGLVNKCVPAAQLTAEVDALAARLAAGPARAHAVAKAGLRRAMESSLAAEWEFSLEAQTLLLSGPDFKEAVTALKEGRSPRFR